MKNGLIFRTLSGCESFALFLLIIFIDTCISPVNLFRSKQSDFVRSTEIREHYIHANLSHDKNGTQHGISRDMAGRNRKVLYMSKKKRDIMGKFHDKAGHSRKLTR